MKRLKITGSGLIVIIAACALAVPTGALAGINLPEWGKCVAKANGRYRDAGCTERAAKTKGHKSGGEYEWIHSPQTIDAAGGTAIFQAVGGREIVCGSEGGGVGTSAPFFTPQTSSRTVTQAQITFRDCHEPISGATCQNGAEGEIKTRELKGVLGFISGGGTPHPTVGLSLELSSASLRHPPHGKRVIAEFACPTLGLDHIIIGQSRAGTSGASVIAPIEPVDAMTSILMRTFSESAPGLQSISQFESGSEDVLEIGYEGPEGPFGKVALLLTTTCTAEYEPIEIRAYVS